MSVKMSGNKSEWATFDREGNPSSVLQESAFYHEQMHAAPHIIPLRARVFEVSKPPSKTRWLTSHVTIPGARLSSDAAFQVC
jgi:hypothetical protein